MATPKPGDYVIKRDGHITELKAHRVGGWETKPGGWIPDQSLCRDWRILLVEDRRAVFSRSGTSIDPPEPATEHIPWHATAGRWLPGRGQVFVAKRYRDGAIDLDFVDGGSLRNAFETIEVLKEDT